MTGSTLAAILIPPAGTICLAAWPMLVFHAGRDHPQRASRNPAPGHQSPGPPSRSGRGGGGGPVWPRRLLAGPGSTTTITATPAGIVAT